MTSKQLRIAAKMTDHTRTMLKRMAADTNDTWRALAYYEIERYFKAHKAAPAMLPNPNELKVSSYLLIEDTTLTLVQSLGNVDCIIERVLRVYVEAWRKRMGHTIRSRGRARSRSA